MVLTSLACAGSSSAPSDYLTQARHPSARLWAGGQPDQQALRSAKAAGVELVVNLRAATEDSVLADERASVEALGMRYVNIPVAGRRGLTFTNAGRLARLLAETEPQRALIHCRSGNRVGALMAMIGVAEGLSVEAALGKGRIFGLTKLEPVVRSVLETCAQASSSQMPAECEGFAEASAR